MTASTAELLVELVIEAADAERDLLVLLIGGTDLDEAAKRLGIDRRTAQVRLQRFRRRAGSVAARGTI